MYSFRVANIGAVLELRSRTNPACESIALAYLELNEFPNSILGGMLLTKLNKTRVRM